MVLVGGDFRQILLVTVHGGKEDILNALITCSYLWKSFKVYKLMINMRIIKKPTN